MEIIVILLGLAYLGFIVVAKKEVLEAHLLVMWMLLLLPTAFVIGKHLLKFLFAD